ncbi:MAG TPA: hypothetical protein VKB59_19070 [Micromonosporaceae bacterium]|nr:hypothetical protein [Micromonosporaceae bacterium]
MDESGWLPDEADEPTTNVRRRFVDGGRCHEIMISVAHEAAAVRVHITEPGGRLVGEVSGEIPAVALTIVGELIGDGMFAAGRAHGGTGSNARSDKPDAKRPKLRNQGARWTPDEEALLAERFSAGATIAELRGEFGRTDTSIRARLVQLNLLPADEWPARLGARHPAA